MKPVEQLSNREIVEEARRHQRGAAPRCHDCGRLYGAAHGFPDLVVPDEVWRLLSPTGDAHGLLCPCCMVVRAEALGLEHVDARFTSGPFVSDAVRVRFTSSDRQRG